jgi:hypothetical protein
MSKEVNMGEMNIYEKLSNIQKKLKAPKGQENTFGGYRYRSAEDILENVKPICNDFRTTLILTDTVKAVNGVSDTRFYVEASAILVDWDSQEKVVVTAFAREPSEKKKMDDSQITGTSSSYARKYAMNGLFNIDDTKDADTDEYHKQTTVSRARMRDMSGKSDDPLLKEKKALTKRCSELQVSAEQVWTQAGWKKGMKFDEDMVAKCNQILDEIEQGAN